jgi:hypothetical protein
MVVFKSLTHVADMLQPPLVNNSHTAMDGSGTKVNQNPVCLENPMGLVKGMNHALLLDSSQSPGKDDKIERFVWLVKAFCLSELIANALSETPGAISTGGPDQSCVRVNRVDERAQPCKPQG